MQLLCFLLGTIQSTLVEASALRVFRCVCGKMFRYVDNERNSGDALWNGLPIQMRLIDTNSATETDSAILKSKNKHF